LSKGRVSMGRVVRESHKPPTVVIYMKYMYSVVYGNYTYLVYRILYPSDFRNNLLLIIEIIEMKTYKRL
jgi:hypothetical protein